MVLPVAIGDRRFATLPVVPVTAIAGTAFTTRQYNFPTAPNKPYLHSQSGLLVGELRADLLFRKVEAPSAGLLSQLDFRKLNVVLLRVS